DGAAVHGAGGAHLPGGVRGDVEVVDLEDEGRHFVDQIARGHREEVVGDLDREGPGDDVEEVDVGDDLPRRVDGEARAGREGHRLLPDELGRVGEEDVGDDRGEPGEGVRGAGVAVGVGVGADGRVHRLGDEVTVVQPRRGVEAARVDDVVLELGI